MKQLLLIGTTVIALTTGGLTAASNVTYPERPQRGSHVSVARLQFLEAAAQDAAAKAKAQQLKDNEAKVNKAIKKLSANVNKTWYVFSGATPRGWDCSGLTMWFYEQLGIELEHRASKQDTAGVLVNEPKPGDLVVFHYKGNKDAYHVGVYVGNGDMIHSPKHGHLTRVENVNKFGGDYSDITYRRMIEN